MAEDKKLTIYQRLSRLFSDQAQGIPQPTPSYEEPKQILKTDNREEYEQQMLQLQQAKYLDSQWKKVDSTLYQQSLYYSSVRLSSYYDFNSMEYCIAGDTKIPTPDGFITIKELADKGRDYEFITYAYDHNIKRIVPAKARNAHYTRDEMTYKVTFDDDSYIIGTIEHRFLKRDGEFVKLKDLKINDSMMPFYRKSFYNNEKYNWIYVCDGKQGHHGWISEHNLIAEWAYGKIEKDEEVHHIDFNGKNNQPQNLKIWNINEHRSYHATLNSNRNWGNSEFREKMKKIMKSIKINYHRWNGERSGKNNPAYFETPLQTIIEAANKKITIRETAKLLDISIPKIQRTLKSYGFNDWINFLEKNNIDIPKKIGIKNNNYKHIPWDLFIEKVKQHKRPIDTAKSLNVSIVKVKRMIKDAGYNNWDIFLDAYGIENNLIKKEEEILINHKIKSIEPYGIIPVYDLTVPGYKNFATDTIFSHNTPEISAALDIYSEESTMPSEDGQVITVYSESDRIKNVLQDLFSNVLDLETNLQMWTRNTCKYGDNFIYLRIDPKKGIYGCSQLPNIEIERIEEGHVYNNTSTDNNKKKTVKFTWKKNQELTFNTWEMAHFRILGDDVKLPYGTSMLDKARRVWKQLLLSEDAMMIYRITRAPERRVFKVFVGNMDDKDVEAYVQKVANKFKRDVKIDPQTGQADLRYNTMAVDQDFFIPIRDITQTMPIETLPGGCISLDTKIPLLDGRTLMLSEIITEWDNGNRNLWVYSCNPKTGELAPGQISWAGITRKNAKVLKIILDNGKEIIATPDHKFVHKTKGFIEARDLIIGDSLMPFYRNKEKIRKNNKSNKYDTIWDNKKNKWVFTHRMVAHFMKKLNMHEEVVFYDEFINESNNKFHSKTFGKHFSKNGYKDKVFSKSQKIKFTDKLYQLFVNEFRKNNRSDITREILNNDQEFMTEFKTVNKNIRSSLTNLNRFTHNHVEKMVKEKGFKNFRSWKKDITSKFNHKIVSILLIDELQDTGTITVDGNELYHDYHTFAIDCGIFIKNSNMGEIADIEYIQKKLLAALRIPKAFIGFEESVGDGKNLALLDIRFARTINRIQRSMIMELNKIAKIHLFILGFTDELDNFKLALTNPSTQADLLRIESWKEKIQLYRDATTDPGNGILPMSATMAKRKVLGMSDSDIKLDLEQQRMEIAAANELKNTPNVITHTGIFDEVDKIYGIGKAAATPPSTEGSPTPSPSPSSSMPSSPSPTSEPNPTDEGGETGTEGTAAEPLPGGGAEEIVPNESLVNSNLPLLNEQSSITKGQRTLKDIYDKLNDLDIE